MYRLPKEIENKYRFVTLSALRAEQLQAGARPRVESLHRKATVLAQEEVAAGVINVWDPESEAQEAEAAEPAAEE